ncbi:hypothetical protein MBELCI_2867 [Limimaricola cinnabarinus LL-001]|uniref:Uncharacterized protein n=1 Tax=Limimaricola cinnabarinus LL-001 TaxID=1337093 RepID=U2Z601_9RHOB|nr:hypothetical protein MBELCI_2867 [Limimaricola cinnabarinus LL-001]
MGLWLCHGLSAPDFSWKVPVSRAEVKCGSGPCPVSKTEPPRRVSRKPHLALLGPRVRYYPRRSSPAPPDL